MKKKKLKESEPFSHKPFDKLGNLLEASSGSDRKPLPPATGTPEKSDDDIFWEAMKEVREIDEFRNIAIRRRSLPHTRAKGQPSAESLHDLEEIVSGKRSICLADTQEFVEWVNPKYHRELVKDLHRGRFAVQDYIDLHGCVAEEAESVLRGFLREAKRRGYHCVKIIHGRGLRSPAGPVLKKLVVDLLSVRYRRDVIGFCSARQSDGGLGALYVLLR